jgi:hypothetical protein
MYALEQAVALVHLLAAAGWFGALVYRAFFVDPRALRFFGQTEGYEQFSLALAERMRWVVMAALLTSGLSGFVLLGLRWNPSAGWQGLMLVKAVSWAAAFAVFAYVSWVFWPRRLFAVRAEYRGVRRQGLALALTMIALAGLGIVLGQVGQALRAG